MPGRNPRQFPLAIQFKVDPYAKELSPSTWVVRTNMEPLGILNLLRAEILPGEKISVIHLPVGTTFASEGLSKEETQHLTFQ